MKILITGAAGFIGYHLAKRLLEKGETVIGIDNLNDYYDVRLKYARLKEIEKCPDFKFIKMDIADKTAMDDLFKQNSFDIVCNLAAQAGVRYSTENPTAYIYSNIIGFINILECCKEHNCKLIYASSSSVYGGNKKLPFSESDPITMPKNLYAKTKVHNEYLAQMYSNHFGLQTIGLRLFSVYGTLGRPDMAYMIFVKAILNHLPVYIYGDGSMKRDYTFVGDVVAVIEKIIACSTNINWYNEIFNIGNSNPISILELIEKLETKLGIKATKEFCPQRCEEIDKTFADCSKLEKYIAYKPNTSIGKGISEFVEWYLFFTNR